MIGIVLVTHGRLAEEFIAATEHVVGKQQAIAAICIAPEDNMETRRQDIIRAVAETNQGKGVAIMTDMFGGTPSNLAISLLGQEGIEVIAGINLPMLIKLVSVRKDMPLKEAVLAAQEAGRKYINVATNLLGGSTDKKSANG